MKVLLLIGFFNIVLSAKFPNDINKCKYEEDKCLVDTITNVLKTKRQGHAGLNLPIIDPLYIAAIDIVQGGESPVNIELNFKNIDLIGLSNAKVSKTSGFGKNINDNKYEIHLKTPSLGLLSDYKISGRVLILPIQGVGKSNLTIENCDVVIKFSSNSVEVNGKEYMKIDKFKLSFNTTRLYMDFGNLFNGDKALGDNTNLFLNENWEDIFNELKKSIFNAFGLVIKNLLNNVFAKIPYHDMFQSV